MQGYRWQEVNGAIRFIKCCDGCVAYTFDTTRNFSLPHIQLFFLRLNVEFQLASLQLEAQQLMRSMFFEEKGYHFTVN